MTECTSTLSPHRRILQQAIRRKKRKNFLSPPDRSHFGGAALSPRLISGCSSQPIRKGKPKRKREFCLLPRLLFGSLRRQKSQLQKGGVLLSLPPPLLTKLRDAPRERQWNRESNAAFTSSHKNGIAIRVFLLFAYGSFYDHIEKN